MRLKQRVARLCWLGIVPVVLLILAVTGNSGTIVYSSRPLEVTPTPQGSGLLQGLLPGDPEFTVKNLAWSPDGQNLAIYVANNVTVYDFATHEPLYTLNQSDDVVDIVYSPDSAFLALNIYRVDVEKEKLLSSIEIRNAATGTLLMTISNGNSHYAGVAFSADGTTLFTVEYDGGAHILKTWNSTTGDVINYVEYNPEGVDLYSLAQTAHGPALITLYDSGTVAVWNGVSDEVRYDVRVPSEPVYDMDISYDGSTVTLFNDDDTITLIDLSTSTTRIFSSGGLTCGHGFTHDSNLFITGTMAGDVIVRTTRDGEIVRSGNFDLGPVCNLDVNPIRDVAVFSGGTSTGVWFWDLDSDDPPSPA